MNQNQYQVWICCELYERGYQHQDPPFRYRPILAVGEYFGIIEHRYREYYKKIGLSMKLLPIKQIETIHDFYSEYEIEDAIPLNESTRMEVNKINSVSIKKNPSQDISQMNLPDCSGFRFQFNVSSFEEIGANYKIGDLFLLRGHLVIAIKSCEGDKVNPDDFKNIESSELNHYFLGIDASRYHFYAIEENGWFDYKLTTDEFSILGYALTEKAYVYHVNPTSEEYYEEINQSIIHNHPSKKYLFKLYTTEKKELTDRVKKLMKQELEKTPDKSYINRGIGLYYDRDYFEKKKNPIIFIFYDDIPINLLSEIYHTSLEVDCYCFDTKTRALQSLNELKKGMNEDEIRRLYHLR